MWAVLVAALRSVFYWLIGGSVVKFVVFTALAYLFAYIIEFVTEKVDLTAIGGVDDLMNGLPAAFFYYFGYFRFDVGIPLVVAAFFVRFGIRRLPFIG